jgi:hypothetical protein
MNKTAIAITLILVVTAVAIAVILRPAGSVRLEALEDRLGALERRVAELVAEPADTDLVARLDAVEAMAESQIEKEAVLSESEEKERDVMARLQHIEHSVAQADQAISNTIDERVAEVVDEKVSAIAEKQAVMQNKKPSLDDFAVALDLTYNQRVAVEDEVRFGQKEVRNILDIPTADGSNLVKELVEVLAHGGIEHPETSKRFMKWVGRVMSETIPGTDDTYGTRIEAAKNKVRAGFRKVFTDKQYADFEKWGLDPTEIQEIENNPWTDIGELIQKRMLELKE